MKKRPEMTQQLDRIEALLLEAKQRDERIERIGGIVSDLMWHDNHRWSERPCTTCRCISLELGVPFGCDRTAKRNPKQHEAGLGHGRQRNA